jgi:hypothetical protein
VSKKGEKSSIRLPLFEAISPLARWHHRQKTCQTASCYFCLLGYSTYYLPLTALTRSSGSPSLTHSLTDWVFFVSHIFPFSFLNFKYPPRYLGSSDTIHVIFRAVEIFKKPIFTNSFVLK